MRTKVLVVDDEKLAQGRILRFCGELGFDFEILEAESGLAALESIPGFQPDILLLDIQMPGLSGLEVLQQLEARPFRVIFQTAHDEFALQAFSENACDYLLKPYSKERFQTALQRALESLKSRQRLDALEKEFRKRDGFLRKISVRRGQKIHLIEATEVFAFVSQDHYTILHTEKGEFMTELSLSFLVERLDPEMFFRCHRGNIVRLEKIERIGTGANMTVFLKNGLELPVSRQNRQLLTEKIG